ncbi:unnamed protein product [Miscanthus lutarioriparius]|uniref:F-box domain-containing protein n=1 Tax=Miscanthus lutarioriparius TaxID=422564 RepID=A0A811SMP4_9POAL|nr:unnamed protein product [Miscanthus lutarioriparius]
MEQHDDEQQDLAAVPMPTAITLIPDDVLADVFRRASPRGLAACRCVCRAWRALIDDRRLLRADLLPLSLAALLLCLNVEWDRPELFARPGADVTGYLMPRRTTGIDDHCNGLILINHDVLNPATGRVVRLPKCPPSPLWGDPHFFFQDRYLAFDPAESPHYQVFCIPMLLTRNRKEEPAYRAISQCEWPPSPFFLSVFSSMTGRWEARSLVRQGGAAGSVDDMDVQLSYEHAHSACWRVLYVHCQNYFVLRISLSEHTTTYQVIQPPRELEGKECSGRGRLGRSEKGVYFACFDRESHLCVWILHDDSSCGHMEWILRHRSAYGLALPSSPRSSWTLHNAFRSEDGNADAQEWDSDDDDGEESTLHAETEDRIQERLVDCEILALHPYREIVFMFTEAQSREVTYAYHLKSSKLDNLGNLFPKDGTPTPGCFTLVENAFPYTPCWIGAP